MKDPYTTDITNKDLKELIDFCEENRGTIVLIKAEFERITGRPWLRHNFERWLNPRPERRHQPLYGVGKLLIQVGKRVMKRRIAEADF